MDNRYYNKYAVAAVRGAVKRLEKNDMLRAELMEKELDALTEKECDEILERAEICGIKLYHFKATHNDMPRVKKVLGFLRGIYFESLLDVGSGRGVFLIPFMENFPYVNVTSLDILERRILMLEDIAKGGAEDGTHQHDDRREQRHAVAQQLFALFALGFLAEIDDVAAFDGGRQ